MTKQIGIMRCSPTNTTKSICAAVALGMGTKDLHVLAMTLPKTRTAIIANINTVAEKTDHLIQIKLLTRLLQRSAESRAR